MKRLSTLLIAAVLPVAFAAPRIRAGRTGRSVLLSTGNTTIDFKAADSSDIDLEKLHTWSDFASQHPDIARTLAYNPSLIKTTAT